MSTHKWIGNIKTCGIIRFGEKALPPNPPAISFGWDFPAPGQLEPSIEETQSRFLWIGMLDSYISYITLGKAIQVLFLMLDYFRDLFYLLIHILMFLTAKRLTVFF